LQAPDDGAIVIRDPNQERPRKRSREEPNGSVPNYFPASFEHTFGPLSIPPSQHHDFPHNVSFRAADWVNNDILEDKDGYDVVIAYVITSPKRGGGKQNMGYNTYLEMYRFSISKWIHLNGGDDALMRFFHRVHSVLDVGGVFVLEPQIWDTYAKAKRMDEVCPLHFSRTLRLT